MTRGIDDLYMPNFPEECICGAELADDQFFCSLDCARRAERQHALESASESLYYALMAHDEGYCDFDADTWAGLVHSLAELWLGAVSVSEHEEVEDIANGAFTAFAAILSGRRPYGAGV